MTEATLIVKLVDLKYFYMCLKSQSTNYPKKTSKRIFQFFLIIKSIQKVSKQASPKIVHTKAFKKTSGKASKVEKA